jgi:hypothetical protein
MEKQKDAKGLAWKMFEETGNNAYYMLYKRLQEIDEE